MSLIQIAVLAIIQGFAELLPISSSAHVIIAEKLMSIDPSSPQMTFMLVMLHTGTTFAVILYFWRRWYDRLENAIDGAAGILKTLAIATAATGIIGLALKHWIEKVWLRGTAHQEVEALFSNLPLIAIALGCAGLLILAASRRDVTETQSRTSAGNQNDDVTVRQSFWVGAVQGLCLPFRGFSRSGATISVALLCGVPRALAEDFSFALAVILTPPVIAKEAYRLLKAPGVSGGSMTAGLFLPGLIGTAFSFCAGLLALRWLSSWLERGRWKYFGWYCLAASVGVFIAARTLH